jgi:hypothetical protein
MVSWNIDVYINYCITEITTAKPYFFLGAIVVSVIQII